MPPNRFWDSATATEHVSGWRHLCEPLTAVVSAMASADSRPADVAPSEHDLVDGMTWSIIGGQSVADPNEAFWESWHADKAVMLARGWSAIKVGGRWAAIYRARAPRGAREKPGRGVI